MAKSRDAFRTISEVSDWLDTPAHVLRFWESKFSQIKPVKRAGGRRYYRPQDIALLGGIKTLLHEQGMTIKGAQKLLREQGVKHVASLGIDLDDTTTPVIEVVVEPLSPPIAPVTETVTPETVAPPPPAVVATSPPGLISALRSADTDVIRANAAQIAPLVAQLEILHAQMRGV